MRHHSTPGGDQSSRTVSLCCIHPLYFAYLTAEAGIDVDDGYLKPHGARRALGADLYAAGHSELAQSALRHKSIETTHDAYADIQAAAVADDIDAARNKSK